ncbi:MAG: rod shape-determining protein RodA [Actinobacteria bacterium]|nr:rod shape-determining protein RodA [Actinomycetota bacterium]
MTEGYRTTFKRRQMSLSSSQRNPYWRRLDWVLIGASLSASLLGCVLVWSAGRSDLAEDPLYFLKRHAIYLVVGLALALLVSRIDHRLMRAYTPVVYGVSLLGLLLVFSPLGYTIGGARGWFKLPMGITLQPAEFAKVAIILMLAMMLSEKRDAESAPRDRDVLFALLVAAVPLGLVLLQNDTGTVLIMGTIIVAMVAVSGARTRWVAGMLAAAVTLGVLAVPLGLLKDYQIQRLTAFVDPTAEASAGSYAVNQAAIAIGGGGVSGQGLFSGTQTQGGFVPVNESDFIFAVAGEELGFIGAMVILVLMAVILWRGIRIALKAQDLFGRLVATGVVAWLAFQMFENIGMNLGIMPVTGVPLPFVSFGGTSMIATWLGIGLLLNVRIHSDN